LKSWSAKKPPDRFCKDLETIALRVDIETQKENSMSVLGNIVSSIFHHASSSASSAAAGAPSPQSKPSTHASRAPAGATVDVAGVMDKLASQSKEKLDWRRSIVDMMKLLNLDSSVGARKHLAEELHYTGNINDSAAMNVWLHKQVMIKLAENGGKVPNELKA
jgi:hypothetical protein